LDGYVLRSPLIEARDQNAAKFVAITAAMARAPGGEARSENAFPGPALLIVGIAEGSTRMTSAAGGLLAMAELHTG